MFASPLRCDGTARSLSRLRERAGARASDVMEKKMPSPARLWR
ncbi:MAG: hypothetical protein OJF62_001379 [Pseudolabrys sp.]|nr:hypothetical protein [Pseudolabrys sp.]